MIRAQLPVLPLVLTLTGALLVSILGIVRPRVAWPLAVTAVGAAALAALAGVADVVAHGSRRYAVGGWPPPWGIEVVLDPLSSFMAAVVACVAAATLIAARSPAARFYGSTIAAFYALALVAVTGFLGVIASGDMFNVFVFLEIAAIASYALVASAGGPALAAAFRYLLLGTVGASFYLLGVGLLYALTGTLNMADLAARLPALGGSPLFVGGVGFVLVGLAIKTGLFPLHGWLPDAYTHAPTPVTALLAGVATKAAAYALARMVWYVLRPVELPVPLVLTWAGAAAIVVGGVLALRAHDVRRMLAYSSVSQLGYIALGFGLATPVALAGAYLHILNHAVMKASLFLVVGAALAAGGRPLVGALGLGRHMPVTAACAIVAAISMIGLPPAGGFFSKWYLLQAAVATSRPLAVAAILVGSLLAAAYMYRFTEAIWATPVAHAGAGDPPASMQVGLLTLAAATLAVGLASAALMDAVLLPAAAGAF
ncbi:MAG: hydrogenase 4 subunit B [Candidatus Rokubacteria bacterium]|nr:hydrogenase 4 subunit B [Candidatus Rokubacteria bacterium]